MKLYLERVEKLVRLAPLTEDDFDKIRKIAPGDLVVAHYRKRRNGKLFRKFHALVTMIAENHPHYSDPEDVRRELKLRTHHYREHVTEDGVLIFEPKSIAFDECEPAEFEEFYEKALRAAASMLHGMSEAQIRRYLDRLATFD